eukprot:gene12682-6576_t
MAGADGDFWVNSKKVSTTNTQSITTLSKFNPPSAGDPNTGGGGNTEKCPPDEKKSKIISIILVLFVPNFAVHRFYLGYTLIGIVWILLGLSTGGISTMGWMLVDFILLVTDALPDYNGCPLA